MKVEGGLRPQLWQAGTFGNLLNDGTDEFLAVTGITDPTVSRANTQVVTGRRDIVVRNMLVLVNTSPGGAGKTRTFTLEDDNVPTALEVVIENAEVSGEDIVNEVTVLAGSRVNWLSDAANLPDASRAQISAEIWFV